MLSKKWNKMKWNNKFNNTEKLTLKCTEIK